MGLNDNPTKMPELNLIPETERGIDLDKGMKQVLSLLTAYSREERVALRASPFGALFTASPELVEILHIKAAAFPVNMVGPDISCSQVIGIAHPANGGYVWVNVNKPASSTAGWPVGGLVPPTVNFTIKNLNQLNFLMEVPNETFIIAYAR